jgi:uncharacterized SAM-binding protein YcdF (DUF218 family)
MALPATRIIFRALRLPLVLLTALCLIACTTYRVISLNPGEGRQADPRQAGLVVRDYVEVTMREGRRLSLEITAIDDRALTGRVRGSGETAAIAWSEIERIEVAAFDAGRSAALIALVSLALYALARAFYEGIVDRR